MEPFAQIFLLYEVKLTSVDENIRLYLQEKLSAVAKRRSDLDLSDLWPSDEHLTALTKKLSGLFIFASTLARFIESEHREPKKRLQLIVKKRSPQFGRDQGPRPQVPREFFQDRESDPYRKPLRCCGRSRDREHGRDHTPVLLVCAASAILPRGKHRLPANPLPIPENNHKGTMLGVPTIPVDSENNIVDGFSPL